MKKTINSRVVIIVIMFLQNILNAQIQKSINDITFNEKEVIKHSIEKGFKLSEISGYVDFLKNDYLSKKALIKQAHTHSPYESTIQETTIYLNPNKTSSIACPNMGFENNNFVGWTGSYGAVTTGAPGSAYPTYIQTSPIIVNTMGNNTPIANTINYHTIMTTPPINAIYPTCIGYDSIACKIVGANTISQIPVVSPFSQDGASVRMNGSAANNRGCKLKYITTTSATNKKLSYSYALILYDGSHAVEESPYFKVEVKNETTGMLLSGCNASVTIVGSGSSSDSMLISPIGFSILYKKWKLYTIDLSSLPIGTNVSVNFEVASCTQGGHYAYAYVDAECGSGSINGTDYISSDMCAGSNLATLMAPLGLASYQWFNPSNSAISGATSNTLSISSPTIGDIYSVQLINNNGCIETKTVLISNSTVNINNVLATGSCINGNSGTANVSVNGSNGIYTYTWTNISSGNIVSNSQSAINLSPGNYSVNVNSGTCGQSSATVTVPVSSLTFSQQYKNYCGNNTFINTNNGTNYQWYIGTSPINGPNGTNDTLFISNPINGNNYTVVYTNAGNCRDSIKYILSQVSGGSVYMTNIANVCPGNSNGSVLLNLAPINSAPYTYSIKDVSNNIISNASNSSTTYSVINLSAGIYTSTVSDGNCSYNNTFTINTIATNFTMTPGNNNSCSAADTARINFNFGAVNPSGCALSSGSCASPNSIQIGYGTTSNASTDYPSIYSNWYKNARHQILYKASELAAAGVQPGKISSISFNISAIAGTTVYPNFTIKMKCTSDNDLTATAFDNNGLTQVCMAPSQTITAGWNLYSFPYAYEWDGLSNILIDVCSDLTANYTNNSSSPYSITPFISVRWFNNDVTPACMTTNSAVTSSNRPNIKFGNCGIESPSSYSISVSANGTIVQNYNNDSIKIVPVTTPTANIVYTITVTNPNGGCVSSQSYTMSSNLAATITGTNASCSNCQNGIAQVTANCGTGPYIYLWGPGGQTTQVVSGLLPGCYTVTVTDANFNSVSSVTCISFATKLNEMSLENNLSIYPNPSNGLFTISNTINTNKLEVIIFNTLGQTVMIETAKNTNQLSFDLTKKSKGIYYAKVTTDEGTRLFKLILE